MKRFLTQISIFTIIVLVSAFLVVLGSSKLVHSRGFKNHQTDSNLLGMTDNQEYDLIFLGISHARNFSRHSNHEIFETELGLNTFNLAQGGGTCGANEQDFYLKYFISRGNKAKTLVYVLSPPLFFSETLPIASNTFDIEPYRFDFFCDYISFSSQNKAERVISYLQSKVTSKWLKSSPRETQKKLDILDRIDSLAINRGVTYAYNNKLNTENFKLSCIQIEETIKTAIDNGSEIILMIPPAAFGEWPGHNMVKGFGMKLSEIDNISFYDFSKSVLQLEYYYDHHHLNSKGVEYFVSKNLFKLIQDK